MSQDNERRSALLVIDVQQGIVERFGFPADYVRQVGSAVETARRHELAIFFACVGFREGLPEVPSGWTGTALHSLAEALVDGSSAAAIHPLVATSPSDIVVQRRRPSCFLGTDLDIVLRTQGIGHLVIAGNATSRGVMIAQLDAYSRDYTTTVLSDCCADWDAGAHEFVLTTLCPSYGRVVPLEQWTPNAPQG